MKLRQVTTASLSALALSVALAYAADMSGMPGMSPQPNPSKQSAATSSHVATGTITSVNQEARTVTLDHGPVGSLGWPAMTMAFSVKDDVAMSVLAPGQAVKFEFTQADGRYIVTRIEPAAKSAAPAGRDAEAGHGHMMSGMMMNHMMAMMEDMSPKEMADMCQMMMKSK